MIKLPKGPLKVIHISRRAIGENETRTRAALGSPRRLLPVVMVRMKDSPLVEGFGLQLKGTMRLRYDVTKFPPGYEFGSADVRCWLETNDAIEVAEHVGELDKTEESKDG